MKLTIKKLKKLIKEELENLEKPGKIYFSDSRTVGCDKEAFLAAMQETFDKLFGPMGYKIPSEEKIKMLEKVYAKFPLCKDPKKDFS